jgi:hypothetical protein
MIFFVMPSKLCPQMNNKIFHYSPTSVPLSITDSFNGNMYEKRLLKDIVIEWNSRTSISDMCKHWKKERPIQSSNNLLFLVYNVRGLNTHLTDVDILLSTYRPQLCILTEIGAAIKNLPAFPGYNGIAQAGSNAFGGVAIYYNNILKCKVVERDINFLVVEMTVRNELIKIGAIYIPHLPAHHSTYSINIKTLCLLFWETTMQNTHTGIAQRATRMVTNYLIGLYNQVLK